MKRLALALLTVAALAAGLTVIVSAVPVPANTPVRFTTNQVSTTTVVNDTEALYGPYRVSYIGVYVDGVLKCYTESNGSCTATPILTPGLHKVKYAWANCNNANVCPHYGDVTQYVLVPDRAETFYVRIPTVRVKWATLYGVNVSLNGGVSPNAVWLGVALGGGTLTSNVMAGCYTGSYRNGYSQPIPAWPTIIPGVPDPLLKGFDRYCFGSSDTYPLPVGSNPHVVIPVPNYWLP